MDDRDRRPLVMCVAEKPSLALSIASFLSDGKHVTRRGTLDVHEFARRHDGVLCDFRVTAVTGHVLSIDFPARFQSWDVDPASLFDAPVVKTEASRGSRVVEHLEREARGAARLILWLDCDREGENICFEVMDACVPVMRPVKGLSPAVRRAKFSAVTKPAVEAAMGNLGDPDVNQARAVDARQELDLKIGVAFTRFQTNHFRDKFAGLDSAVVSYGPCQTPTLSFVAARRKEIAAHDPEPFWRVVLACPELTGPERELGPDAEKTNEKTNGETNGETKVKRKRALAPALTWRRGRVFDKSVGETYARLVTEGARALGNRARVASTVSTERGTPPPPGLNTVDLLKSCSKGLGMGAHRVMQIAERLYIEGHISYPRTESSAFPKGFDFQETLRACASHPELGNSFVAEMRASAANANGAERDARQSVSRTNDTTKTFAQPAFRVPRGGVDAGDHPPITPASAARSPSDVGGVDAWRVYDLVVRRFVAACARDCVVEQQTLVLEAGGELFDASSCVVKRAGWTEAMPWRAPTETRFFFANASGDVETLETVSTLAVAGVALEPGLTSPPPRMTESELIGLMETHGIGTDASIPSHIHNVEKRRYVAIEQKSRTVDVTDLGGALVAGYDAVDLELASPATRRVVEKQLDLIATGEADHAAVVAHVLKQFAAKYAHFVANVANVDALFELKFDPASASATASAPPFSRCGRCARFLRLAIDVRSGKHTRMYCATEDETYALPTGAVVTAWDGRACPLCDFELALCSFGGDARFPLCVGCFKTKPFAFDVLHKTAKTIGRVPFACPHPSAHPIIEERIVCPCPTCDDAGSTGAFLIVEPGRKTSRATRARLHCVQCDTTLRLPPSVAEARATRSTCGECAARCVEVRFHESETPLAGGETKLVACVACDDLLLRDAALARVPRRGAGGGRGRGRGGRRS